MSKILEFLAEARRRRGDHAEFWSAFDEFVKFGGARRAPANQGHRGEERRGPRLAQGPGRRPRHPGRPFDRGSPHLVTCAAAGRTTRSSHGSTASCPTSGPIRTRSRSSARRARTWLDLVEIARSVTTFERDGRPNSLGRYVLGLPDETIQKMFSGRAGWEELVSFLLDHLRIGYRPPRPGTRPGFRLRAALDLADPERPRPIPRPVRPEAGIGHQTGLPVSAAALALAEGDPGGSSPSALEAAKAALKVDYTTQFDISQLVKTFGDEIIGPLAQYVGTRDS